MKDETDEVVGQWRAKAWSEFFNPVNRAMVK